MLQPVVESIQANLLPYVDQGSFNVFDNASTIDGTTDFLKETFLNVYRADKNVGYWSAIDWWLNYLFEKGDTPKYVYIIESDLVHFEDAFSRLQNAVKFLDDNSQYGSSRLYEWTYNERHLYDKDRPVAGSKCGAWRSHTNYVTGERVEIFRTNNDGVCGTTFLTQLVAINRYDIMRYAFEQLSQRERFVEPDFQRLYYDRYSELINQRPLTAIIEGGLFHCNLGTYGTRSITGSYTSPDNLAKLGYLTTRVASIVPRAQYKADRI